MIGPIDGVLEHGGIRVSVHRPTMYRLVAVVESARLSSHATSSRSFSASSRSCVARRSTQSACHPQRDSD